MNDVPGTQADLCGKLSQPHQRLQLALSTPGHYTSIPRVHTCDRVHRSARAAPLERAAHLSKLQLFQLRHLVGPERLLVCRGGWSHVNDTGNCAAAAPAAVRDTHRAHVTDE